MPLDTDTTIKSLNGRSADRRQLADHEAITGSVTAPISDVGAWTLYLAVEGAVDITVEYSPDLGETWYEPRDESPISFARENTELVQIEYNATNVRLTGSNVTQVTAEIREVV